MLCLSNTSVKVKLILVCASKYSPFGLASTVCGFGFAGRRASSVKSYEETSEDSGTIGARSRFVGPY